ncbi:hypothetical protein SAMN05421773_12468 [Streptomyces aidingensis]|uniref:Uncharacterized protein n=1 Tax=Streptomyces aidingensis TaxID=910347 RepID=A0A1I1UIR6_9ACTN|nr:hypothetical protein SAMN05421773_12468 [Streptomyces aidingensis]
MALGQLPIFVRSCPIQSRCTVDTSKQEFPQGDLCTNRYREGYYADLFDLRYRPELAANFSDEPEPAR